MKKFNENYFENKNAAEIAARNEGNIFPEQLLQEIEPLLREYFIGDFMLTKSELEMKFKNGQKFYLTIGEVV